MIVAAADQLVAVQRVDVARVLSGHGREAQAAAAPERLRLLHRRDLGAEARQLLREQPALAGGAADDDALDACPHQQPDLVCEQRPFPDADERLRPSGRSLAEPLGPAAGEHDRLADHCGTASGSGVSAAAPNGDGGRPTPS